MIGKLRTTMTIIWLSFQVFLSVVSVSFGDAPPCPPSKDIYPCFCDGDRWLTSISCEGINSLDKLYPVLKNTRGLNMSFAFYRMRIDEIPSDLFEGQQSVNLHFDNCKIASFGNKPFSGLEDTLKDIYIYDSVDKRRKDLKTFPLGHLKKLKSLAFQANDIVRLGNDWFNGGPETIQDLNLEANDIEELGDKAFASLVNVEQIWLGDNRVRSVSRSMFPSPANKLWLLEISFNGIEDLPTDMFEGFPALKTVNLSGNKLKTISETIWGNVWQQLNEVYLERNYQLICDEKIKWIYQQELPRIFTGKCTGDNKLARKELEDLTEKDFE